ncbi:alpha/beta hydrolase [Sphingomonas colocasiae]|uniref:Alpha/beta hydrolase n=1 Tax=Sphingomonas colocasiae TaxID=1848973 RepID=A0ABS7PW95_9SPHN|nr:alpha/beta hydrolase fold domain-containing protein [Sphingomonas colocasiae]MBY8825229.1 alpha/beta hydrolase [Sphingomonas colocasiae]
MIDEAGTVRVRPMTIPLPGCLSEAAKAQWIRAVFDPPPLDPRLPIAEQRAAMDRIFYAPRLAAAKALYPARITSAEMGGVRVDIVEAESDIADRTDDRVLICLHGGGFRIGAGMGALLEAIPVASKTGIRTVAIDYRMGPEHEFPAASEDVAAVYRALLQSHAPGRIGIYGNSAGGVLTAMAAAWFAEQGLPAPGALCIVSAPADNVWGGDSRYTVLPLVGWPAPAAAPNPPPTGMPYVRPEDLHHPLVSPALFPEAARGFPPTMFVCGTRDGAVSSAIASHSRLVAAGVDATLELWEGMGHGFVFDDVNTPEAIEALELIARHFEDHLGARDARQPAPAGSERT